MKLILNIFPRPWLIRLSIWFLPLIKIYYSGRRFIDPIDGSSYRKFLPYGYQKLRKNALCPGTLSLERHRLLWLYLERETNIFKKKLNVLHIAPEQVFFKIFKKFENWNYTTCDLNSPLADIKSDICNLPFKNNSYDLILCNHVLEHIPDHNKAISELYRILKKGGILIAQVPIDFSKEKTFEDFNITNNKERNKIFGQYDHVRVYGTDFFSFLNQAGFKTKSIDYINKISKEEIQKFGLKKDIIPIGYKV